MREAARPTSMHQIPPGWDCRLAWPLAGFFSASAGRCSTALISLSLGTGGDSGGARGGHCALVCGPGRCRGRPHRAAGESSRSGCRGSWWARSWGWRWRWPGRRCRGCFRNPMADPGIIGVSAGGALGAVIAIATGFTGLFFPGAAVVCIRGRGGGDVPGLRDRGGWRAFLDGDAVVGRAWR